VLQGLLGSIEHPSALIRVLGWVYGAAALVVLSLALGAVIQNVRGLHAEGASLGEAARRSKAAAILAAVGVVAGLVIATDIVTQAL